MEGRLGELQVQILKALSLSKEPLIVNQISSILERDKTTVFKSVDNLLEKKYLVAHQEYLRGRKYLKFSDKGAFIALEEAGISLGTLIENHPYVNVPSFVVSLQNIVEPEFLGISIGGIFALINSEAATFDSTGKYNLDAPGKEGIRGMMMLQIVEGLWENAGRMTGSFVNTPAMVDYAKEAQKIVAQRVDFLSNEIWREYLNADSQTERVNQVESERTVFEKPSVDFTPDQADRIISKFKEYVREKE